MKCRYCGVTLPEDWRKYEHPKICKNATPEQRYIHSGIPQSEYPLKRPGTRDEQKKKYKYTDKCNEISGFGGGYENACRKMVVAGMEYLDNNPDAKITFSTFKNITGLIFEESEDCEKMQKVMVDAIGGDCTGAMMQACLQHVKYAQKNGWDNYIKEMEKPRDQAKEGE